MSRTFILLVMPTHIGQPIRGRLNHNLGATWPDQLCQLGPTHSALAMSSCRITSTKSDD